jgi:hypothetical protein
MSIVKINLLPPEIKKKRVAEKGFVMLTGVLIIVIGLCSLITVVLFMKSGSETKGLDVIKAETNRVTSKIGEFAIYKERQNQVQAHGISIQSMKLDESGMLTMSGCSFEYETVADFLIRLNDLDMIKDIWLEKVDTEDLTEVKIIGKDTSNTASTSTGQIKVSGVVFSITAKLKNPVVPILTKGNSSNGGNSNSGSGGST